MDRPGIVLEELRWFRSILSKGGKAAFFYEAQVNILTEAINLLERREPLTDEEQRIFLAAMGREEKICRATDAEYDFANMASQYDSSLTRICHEITRKVKKSLWR